MSKSANPVLAEYLPLERDDHTLIAGLRLRLPPARREELRRAHHDALDAIACLRAIAASVREGYRFDDARAAAVLIRYDESVDRLAHELGHLTPAYQTLINEAVRVEEPSHD